MLILIITIGVSFAYFTANLTGGEDSTTITVTGGSMNIYYEGGANITMNNIYPKKDAWSTKTFTVTGNSTTDLNMEYSLNLVIEENTFSSTALKYKLISTNTGGNGEVVPSKTTLNNILHGAREIDLGTGTFTSPTSGNKVHTYNLEIYFPETGKNQNKDQGKTLKAYISVVNGDNSISIPDYYVMAKDEDFVKAVVPEELLGVSIPIWGYVGSDEYVIVPETIQGETITHTIGMFGHLPGLLESTPVKGVAIENPNIYDMTAMFYINQSETLELKYLNTSNVTSMFGMFYQSSAVSLDLSNFDTSRVTDMAGMFTNSQGTSLDLSSFDTSNVTDMSAMFYSSSATNLDLSSFDTSNLTDMSGMFRDSQATTLDLSSFDTSNVTDMGHMFYDSQATTLDLSSFDTSNVTDMGNMFHNSQATTLDLSSFVTSNVTNMHQMFDGSQATSLDLSSFDTSSVISMDFMFAGSQATTGYARPLADANRFNSSIYKPAGLTFIVK